MTLLIECIVGIILFTLIVVPLTLKDPLGSVGDYPPAIRERCIELGLVSKTEKRFTTKELIKKLNFPTRKTLKKTGELRDKGNKNRNHMIDLQIRDRETVFDRESKSV